MYVSFRFNGKKIYLRVHRVVATCFIPNPNNLPEINHIDCDPNNNAVSNLEWCTHNYNVAYKEKYGKSAKEVFGRPAFAVDLMTGKVLYFESCAEAGRKLGINHSHISDVLNGKLSTTGGYWFTEDESEITKEKIQEIKNSTHFLGGVVAINLEAEEVFCFESQSEASRKLGVNQGNFSRVLKGQREKIHDFWLCYADKNVVEKTREKFGDEIAGKVQKMMNN